jgi:hypothetical protein
MEPLAHHLTWRPGLPTELIFIELNPASTLDDYSPEFREGTLRFEKAMQDAAARRQMAKALPSDIARIASAAGRARAAVKVRTGRPQRFYREPLGDLASIWVEATGTRPTVTYDFYQGGRGGAFRTFVYAASAPVLPAMGSVDKLIEKTCQEWRKACAEWLRRGQL